MLSNHEDKQLENDLETVFTRMEHRRLKEKLRDFDSKLKDEHLVKLSKLNSGLAAAHSMNKLSTSSHQKISNKAKFILRIAAIFILIAIPAAILFNSNNSTNNYQASNKKSPKKNRNNSNAVFEKFDFDMNLPTANISNENVKVLQQEQYGFGTEEKTILIEVVYLDNQLKYLAKRQTEIEEYVKRLELAKNKKFKNITKKVRLEQELEKAEKMLKTISIQISAIQKTGFTYQSTNSKIKVFISGKKLSSVIKAYELNDSTYYLKIEDKFYEYKQNKSAQLIKIIDSDKIEELKNCVE